MRDIAHAIEVFAFQPADVWLLAYVAFQWVLKGAEKL